MESFIRRPVVVEEAPVALVEPPKDPAPIVLDLPESKLNLDGIKGYKQKRKELKYLKLKEEAVSELRKSLAIFNKEELHLNHSVVLFACQIAEDLFASKGKGKFKKEVVVEVCRDFFDGKTDVVEMVIELVFEKIVKSSFVRRNKNKVKSLGFFLVEKLLPNVQSLSQARLKAL
jgi:hypothetical protein